MDRKYSTSSPFIEGRAMQIQVRDGSGLYIGSYRGFYDARHQTVTCYPSHNPTGAHLPKVTLSDRLILPVKAVVK